MKLSKNQWKNFMRALENPPKANKDLKELIKVIKRRRKK